MVAGDNNTTAQAAVWPGQHSILVTTFLIIAITVIAFITLAGNILVVIAFITDKKLRTFGNNFILNLAVTDLLVGIFIPFYSPYVFLGRWPYGRTVCILFNTLDYSVTLASSWNIAVISIDRYISVSHPVSYRLRQGPKWAVMGISLPWILGFSVFAPAITLWKYISPQDNFPEGKCWVDFFENIPYLLFGSAMEFVIPFITVFVANLLIYLNIHRRSKAMATSNATKAALARDRKTARSLAILVSCYFITWAPYETCALLNPICGFCIPETMFNVTFWLLWTNSTINPILYPFLQLRFRLAFKKLLCRICPHCISSVLSVNSTGETIATVT